MKFRLVIQIFSLLIAGQVSARVIEVRSGEHDTFSRIVLNIPEGTDWTLTHTGKFAELTIDLPNIKFDTSRVFDRIPTSRLQRIFQRQPGEALQMKLGCECKVTGFNQSGSLLVVDIQDSEKTASFSNTPFYTASVLRFSGVAPMQTNIPNIGWGLQPKNPGEDQMPAPVIKFKKLAAVNFPTQEALTNVNTSELRLLSQIDRATAQGLLLLRMDNSNSDGTNTNAYDGEIEGDVGSFEFPSHISLTATTSVDRDLPNNAMQNRQIDNQHSCLSPDLVALPDWGNTMPFGAQIGNRRSYLFEEFDSVNQQSVVALSRNLIFFGFGIEAKSALDLLEKGGKCAKC